MPKNTTKEKLNSLKEFLQKLSTSRFSALDDESGQRLKDGVEFLFSIDSKFPAKFECFSLILTIDPSILKPRLKELLDLIILRGDNSATSQLIIDLLKNYFHVRQIVDFFKIYIPCLSDSKTAFAILDEELRCMEWIFVDVSHSQSLEIVQLILIALDKLLEIDSELELKMALKLGLILRSITFSSPAVLQNRITCGKLIIDLCDRLTKLKNLETEYRRFLTDILAEMVVKLYLASSTYEKCDVDLDVIENSLPKKSIGLPWKILLPNQEQSAPNKNLKRLISKYIDLASDHDCAIIQDDLGILCLPGYCFVMEFWKSLLSNFALFRHYLSKESIQKVIDFIRQQSEKIDDQNLLMRKFIIDFLSIFDIGVDQSILGTEMDYEVAISEEDRAEIEALEALKSSTIDAITNYSSDQGEKLKSIFDTESILEHVEMIQQLQMAIFAFGTFENSKNVDENVKSFFKDFSNRIYGIVPIMISKFVNLDQLIAVKILTKALDLFSLMITDKALDLPKYPTVSVAFTCAAMVQWDNLKFDQGIDFSKSMEAFLKFLRVGMKKCNNLVISLAPNWVGILRRMQSILFELSSSSNIDSSGDDLAPLFHRLGRFYSSLDRNKELEKIAVFLIYDLVDCLTKRKLSDVQTEALHSGIYRLIGISDQYSIAMITATMDDTSKELFRVLYENYLKYYKYTGQV